MYDRNGALRRRCGEIDQELDRWAGGDLRGALQHTHVLCRHNADRCMSRAGRAMTMALVPWLGPTTTAGDRELYS